MARFVHMHYDYGSSCPIFILEAVNEISFLFSVVYTYEVLINENQFGSQRNYISCNEGL